MGYRSYIYVGSHKIYPFKSNYYQALSNISFLSPYQKALLGPSGPFHCHLEVPFIVHSSHYPIPTWHFYSLYVCLWQHIPYRYYNLSMTVNMYGHSVITFFSLHLYILAVVSYNNGTAMCCHPSWLLLCILFCFLWLRCLYQYVTRELGGHPDTYLALYPMCV